MGINFILIVLVVVLLIAVIFLFLKSAGSQAELNNRLAQFVDNTERHNQTLATTQATAQAETKVRMEQNQTAIDKLTAEIVCGKDGDETNREIFE